MSQLDHCSRCGKVPFNGFVGSLCMDCWKEKTASRGIETTVQTTLEDRAFTLDRDAKDVSTVGSFA